MKLDSTGHLLKNQNLIILGNIFIGLLLIGALLFFIRDLITLSAQPKKKDGSVSRATQEIDRHNLQDYAIILKKNPFGFPAGELKLLSGARTAVSRTDVSLIGTVSGARSLSYAIFMDRSGNQDVFKIGDSVFGLGILSKVEKDKVSLGSVENALEIPITDILLIKEEKREFPSHSATPGFSRKIADDIYSIDQRKIQEAIANPKELMTDARLLPNYVDGAQNGFVLNEIKAGGIYQSLGLQNGDVLLRINDYDISNPELALQAFTALQGMERVQLDILRQGSKMTMTYQIQ